MGCLRKYKSDKSLKTNDIGKKSIPLEDRCEGFDELWNQIYNEVLGYWNFVPITDMSQLKGYIEDE